MGFIEKTFDLKKCARALHRHPGEPERETDVCSGVLTPAALTPVMYLLYLQVLRHNSITIKGLDFDAIDDSDIDDLYNVLENSPANELFHLSDVFKQFEPAAISTRAFI